MNLLAVEIAVCFLPITFSVSFYFIAKAKEIQFDIQKEKMLWKKEGEL